MRICRPACLSLVLLLAATGVRLMIQLARQFEQRPDVRYGLTAMCVGLGQGGIGTGHRRLVAGGIDLVEQLPGLHIATFGKVTLHYDAADLGAHFGNAQGRGATGQLCGELQRRGFQGDHIHGGGRHGAGPPLFGFTATG